MTLSSTAEGAHKQMEGYLDQMVDGIVGFLKDPVRKFNQLNVKGDRILLEFFLFSSILASDMQHVIALVKWRPISLLLFRKNTKLK